MMKDIYVQHSAIVVPDYELGECEKLEGLLSMWDADRYRFKPIGFYYDEETRTLYLPRALDVSYVERLLGRKVTVQYDADPRDTTVIKLTTEPRNDLQRKSIAFLTGEGEFRHNQKRSQMALTLSTGAGKTYCTVAAISLYRTKSIIMTHNDNIKKQWYDAFIEHSNVDPTEICNVEGSKVMNKIMNATKLPYKVYIVNRQTLNSYGKRYGWDKVREFFKKIAVGVKVYDEAHIEFRTILKIDFYSNVYKTFYLTANFERSDPNENRIFKLAFSTIIKYGDESIDVMTKNIIYMPVFFNSYPTYQQRASMKTIRGLDRNKYADYLVNNEYYHRALRKLMPTISKTFTDGKILFMSTTINATEKLKGFLEGEYDISVALYNSKIDDQEKTKALESRFISSTPKSLGTGTDIPLLRIVVNSEPYRSAVTANQVSGRLRYHNDSKYSFYIELIDEGFPECVKMYKARQKVFNKKCAKIKEVRLIDDGGY